MSETMLEITKRVLVRRKHDIPILQHQKACREYWEEGCLCVLNGDIGVPANEPDDVACLFYVMWCGCSRHYDASLRYSYRDEL